MCLYPLILQQYLTSMGGWQACPGGCVGGGGQGKTLEEDIILKRSAAIYGA